MRPRLALALYLMLLVPGLAWAAFPPPEGPPANVRPTFNSGYTSPGGTPGYEDGFGIGAAFEIEQSRAATFLFRVEWDWLSPHYGRSYRLLHPFASRIEISYFTWCAGIRGYLPAGSTLRLYGEFDAGVRMGGDASDHEGPVLIPRIGISVGSFGRPGLLLEVGANFTARDREQSLFVPIRLGIIFP